MMYWSPGMGGWGMALMIIGNLDFWGLLITFAVLLTRYIRLGQTTSSPPAEVSPQQIAAQRFARGEINEDGCLRLLQVLSGGSAEASPKVAVITSGIETLQGVAERAGPITPLTSAPRPPN